MAKRKAKVDPWSGDQRDVNLAELFEGMSTEAQTKLSRKVSVGAQSEENLVGLPLPALCLRYLFQSTVFPLSRIVQLTGEEGSAKSSFLYEMMRWHMVYGGGAVLAENENKDAASFRHSILQWRQDWLSRLAVIATYSLEQWQDVFTKFTAIASAHQDKPDGPGRTIPILFGVDSLMATAPQSEIDSVLKEGHASRGYALAANLIARYMRTMPERIQAYPFTVVGTNHLKPSTDARGLPTSTVPGGKAVKFMETFEVEMRKATGGHDIDLLDYGGLRLRLIAKKNAIGPSRKAITAELLWWYDVDEQGQRRQQAAWDWDTATIELINSFENSKAGKKTVWKYLKDITGIRVVSKSRRTAYSDTLGIPASDPQHYRVVATELEKRVDLLEQVYGVLGIMPYRSFQPGVDYRQTRQLAIEEAKAETNALYEDIESLPELGEALPTAEADATPEVAADPETSTEEAANE